MKTWKGYAKRLIRSRYRYWILLLLVFVFTTCRQMIGTDYAHNPRKMTLNAKFGGLQTFDASYTSEPNGSNQNEQRTGYPYIWQDGSHKAILLSYMRAGTTFVGSAFERNKDIFYMFEPEWALFMLTMNEYQPLQYIDGTIRDPVWIDDADETVERLIRNYLYCNTVYCIDVTSLRQGFMREGQYTRPLYHCMRMKGNNMADCVNDITKICSSKKFRFLKTVRLRVHAIEKLLTNDPNLRIIHMIRDPRGIALSRQGALEYYRGEMTFTFGRVCAEMLRDIESVEKLPPEVADRVLSVLYEEVVENPERVIKQLYNFTQMPYTENIRRYVGSITHAAVDNRKGFSVHRANSSKTAYSWRTKISWELCAKIDAICERVYKKAGYLRAKSEKALRDYNISLRDMRYGSYLDKFRTKNI